MNVSVCTYTYMHLTLGVSLNSFPTSFYFILRQGLLLNLGLTDWLVSKTNDLSVSSAEIIGIKHST